MMIDSNAPVVLAAEVQIPAPADVVWNVPTNVQEWPKWHPGIRSVDADRPPGLEMTFRWRPGPYQIESTVLEFEPQERIGWTGRSLGVAARHVWTIRPNAGGAVVHTDESMTGLLPPPDAAPTAQECAEGSRHLAPEPPDRGGTTSGVLTAHACTQGC